MNLGNFSFPIPVNEPVLNYAKASPERAKVKSVLTELKSKQIDVPMVIGGQEVRTDKRVAMRPPHEHAHVLGEFHVGSDSHEVGS